MTYTIWMHGRQIGETAFEYEHDKRRRAGSFQPTEFGLHVLPSITAMTPALLDFGELCKRGGIDPDNPSDAAAVAALDAYGDTPEGQRVIAAAKSISQLQVRDATGSLVAWDFLSITDLEWLITFAREHGAPAPNEILDSLPEHEPIKYMITLTLRGGGERAARWGERAKKPALQQS